MDLGLEGHVLKIGRRWNALGLVAGHRRVWQGGEVRLQLLAVLLEMHVLHRGIAVVQKAGSIAQAVHAWLLGRGLRGRGQQIGDFLDAFGEVELRLVAQAVSVGLEVVEEFGIDVEERVVVLVLGCRGGKVSSKWSMYTRCRHEREATHAW